MGFLEVAFALFSIFVFPGFLFLGVFGFIAEYADRKLYAKMQNRIGPPWFQPFADFIKLIGKEEIVPQAADAGMFKILPVFAVTAVVSSFLYIPLWKTTSLFSFDGDIIVVLYLLTIPTLTFALGGWHSTSPYAGIGAMRALTQLFAYEVPLFMAILSPAVLANTWSLTKMINFYQQNPTYIFFNIIAFVVALAAIQGKLEKVPFDAPEAETEIVAGAFTEYSGKYYAMFRMAISMELVVGAALIAAVFLPFGFKFGPIIGFLVFLVKTFFIIFLLAVIRTAYARLRIDQVVTFCWKFLAPIALLQIVINFVLKGMLL
ncbi:complex I subunit 1 family protein [Elusimicrobiota bacterium]